MRFKSLLPRLLILCGATGLIAALTGCPDNGTCGAVRASIDGCNAFSWEVECEDLSDAIVDDEVVFDEFNREIRRFGTLTSRDSGNVYEFDIEFERDTEGCIAAMTLTVSGGLVGANPVTVIVGDPGAGEGAGEGQGEPDDPILSVTPGSPAISADGGTLELTVTNEGAGVLEWTAQVIVGQAWITIASGASGTNTGTIVLDIAPHTSPGSRDAFDPREGTVRVTAGDRTRDVVIFQEGDVEEYNLGFDDGFALDEEYFNGYDDSWQTVGFEPVLWAGNEIPFIDDLSFDAGFYDGVFMAYNDGYFVAYRFAFIIGFSEGYDAAFASDFLAFIDSDQHVEFDNGGFDDGYNDGYSEGRIFGGVDFELGLPFDWLDAFLDWESGTDLFFEEIGVGTGANGPVILYEYGTDPLAAKAAKRPGLDKRGGLRANAEKQRIDFARPFRDSDIETLDVRPNQDRRSGRTLDDLESTWLERIEDFQFGGKSLTNTRRASPRAR